MNRIAILFLLISNFIYSQSISQIDSISYVMCNSLKNSTNIKNDTVRINTLYEGTLYPYLRSLESSKAEKVGNQIYYRMQRNCMEFRELLDRLDPPKEGVTRKPSKPISKLTKKDIENFKKQVNFKYFEANGNITTSKMQNGKWRDTFSDRTYSQLDYKWVSETEFELTFTESNNATRNGFSVKGDKLLYNVISKEVNYYVLSVNIPGQTTFEEFKLYLN